MNDRQTKQLPIPHGGEANNDKSQQTYIVHIYKFE